MSVTHKIEQSDFDFQNKLSYFKCKLFRNKDIFQIICYLDFKFTTHLSIGAFF